jgi:alkylhydroperoxidase family enzyme
MRLDPLPQEHSPALADEFASFHKTLGFVPNSVLTMQRKPELVRAFVAMQRAIWDPGSKVDRGFKRLVAHVASRAAGDAYSMAHTASGALHFGIDADKLAAARDYRASPLYNAAEKAALDLAVAALASEASGQRGNSFEVRAHSASEDARKRAGDTRPEPGSSARAASAVPSAVTNELFDELRRHWSEEQIVELVAAIAMAGFLARWNTTMATPIEEEPLAIGRKHLAAQGWSPGAHLR